MYFSIKKASVFNWVLCAAVVVSASVATASDSGGRLARKWMKQVSIEAQASDLAGIPSKIYCGKGSDRIAVEFAVSGPVLPEDLAQGGFVTTDRAHQHLMVNRSDSESFDATVIKKSGLIALAKGKVNSIPAIKISGYADGADNHYTAEPTTCSLQD